MGARREERGEHVGQPGTQGLEAERAKRMCGWMSCGVDTRSARAAASTSAAGVRSSRSSTTTSWPERASISAVERPAALPPMTTTRTDTHPYRGTFSWTATVRPRLRSGVHWPPSGRLAHETAAGPGGRVPAEPAARCVSLMVL